MHAAQDTSRTPEQNPPSEKATFSSWDLNKFLEAKLKTVSPDHAGGHIMERWYTEPQAKLVHLDWSDISDRHGMLPGKIQSALENIPGLELGW